jgi:hypothetical protein
MGLGNQSDSPAIRRFNLGVRAGLAAGERALEEGGTTQDLAALLKAEKPLL